MPTIDQYVTRFGPLEGFVPPQGFDNGYYLSQFAPQLQSNFLGNISSQQMTESARLVDAQLNQVTVAVLFSIRRLYKMLGSIQESAAIADELNSLHMWDGTISIERVEAEKENLNWITSIMLNTTLLLTETVYNRNLSAMSWDEMVSVTGSVCQRVLYFNWSPEWQESNGVKLLKYAVKSVHGQLRQDSYYAWDQSANEHTETELYRGDDYRSPDADITAYLEAVHTGTYAEMSAEQAYDQQVQEQEYLPYLEQIDDVDPTVEVEEPDNGSRYTLKRFQWAAQKLPLQDIFAAIGNLPLVEQAAVLNYFGYVRPELSWSEYYTTLQISQTAVHGGLHNLIELLENPELIADDVPSLPEMLVTTANENMVRASLYEDRSDYSSLFALLNLLQYIPQEELEKCDPRVHELLQITLGNLTYTQQGIVTRNLKSISAALSQRFNQNIDNSKTRRIIQSVVVPGVQNMNVDENILGTLYSPPVNLAREYILEPEEIPWHDVRVQSILRDRDRSLITWAYFENRPMQEICALYGVNSKQAVYAALKNIRQRATAILSK